MGIYSCIIVRICYFGLGHIYQGSTLIDIIAVFSITAMGAIWFAWLYIEWENNLWIPIFLHIMMNVSWTLFNVSENALGGIYTNIFRAITIAFLTIIITICYYKKRGLRINRKNLIINKQPLTRGKNNCRDCRLFKGCSPLHLLCNLIENRLQSATFPDFDNATS
jgi:hypothetical protein